MNKNDFCGYTGNKKISKTYYKLDKFIREDNYERRGYSSKEIIWQRYGI